MQEIDALQACLFYVCLPWHSGQQLYNLLRQVHSMYLAIIPTRHVLCAGDYRAF